MKEEIKVSLFYLVVDLRQIEGHAADAPPLDFPESRGWRTADDLGVVCAMSGGDIGMEVEALLAAGVPETALVFGCEDGLENNYLTEVSRTELTQRLAPWLCVRRTVEGSWIGRCLGEDVLVDGELEASMWERACDFRAIRDVNGVRSETHPFCERHLGKSTYFMSCPQAVLMELDGKRIEVLQEQWNTQGCYAQSLVFHSADVTEKSDFELRAIGISHFGLSFDERAARKTDGGCGMGEGSSTMHRGERFTLVNVVKGEGERWFEAGLWGIQLH